MQTRVSRQHKESNLHTGTSVRSSRRPPTESEPKNRTRSGSGLSSSTSALSPERRDSAQETHKARQMKSSGSQAQNQDRSLLALRHERCRSLRRKLRGGGAVHLLGPRRAQRARSPSGKPLGSAQSLLERAYGSQGYDEKFLKWRASHALVSQCPKHSDQSRFARLFPKEEG